MPYKDHPFERRKKECDAIRHKYPDRIPVICERSSYSKDMPVVDKSKYLIPDDLTMGQFIYVIRKRMRLDQSKALFLFVNGNMLVPTSAVIQAIYEQYRDLDGFLYINYSGENAFGLSATRLPSLLKSPPCSSSRQLASHDSC
jgi:GABA(A) receptor-associated protein